MGDSGTLLGLFRLADMSWSWRGRNSAGHEVEDGANSVENIVLSGQLLRICQRQIGSYSDGIKRSASLPREWNMAAIKRAHWFFRTLKLAVASLNLLVVSLLYVALENSGSRGLAEAGGFQDVRGIDPIVGLTSHHMLPLRIWAYKLELPDGVL